MSPDSLSEVEDTLLSFHSHSFFFSFSFYRALGCPLSQFLLEPVTKSILYSATHDRYQA
jgi:hypothetical protein